MQTNDNSERVVADFSLSLPDYCDEAYFENLLCEWVLRDADVSGSQSEELVYKAVERLRDAVLGWVPTDYFVRYAGTYLFQRPLPAQVVVEALQMAVGATSRLRRKEVFYTGMLQELGIPSAYLNAVVATCLRGIAKQRSGSVVISRHKWGEHGFVAVWKVQEYGDEVTLCLPEEEESVRKDQEGPTFEDGVRVRGVQMSKGDADGCRQAWRRLCRAIDEGETSRTQAILQELKEWAGEKQEQRRVFEVLRKEANDRWSKKHGVCWTKAMSAVPFTEPRHAHVKRDIGKLVYLGEGI